MAGGYRLSHRGHPGPAGARRPQVDALGAAAIAFDITFSEPDRANHAAIDQAYRDKYARHASAYVDPMISPGARAATLRLTPR